MNAEKVKPLHPDNDSSVKNAPQKDSFASTSKDMGKVAIVISILSVLLLVVFYFGMNQNLKGLSAKMDSLSGLQTEIQAVDSKVSGLEEELSGLKNLPRQTKNMVLANSLHEMAQRASMLSSQVNTEAQSAKMIQAMDLLQQVQVELGTGSQ